MTGAEGAAAGGGGQLGGAVIGALGNIAGTYVSSALAMRQAREQMRFQERMSNTAHQREVADLRAAGLNPILSARYGGSSTPPGAQAPIPDFGHSAKTGIEAMTAMQNIRMSQAQIRNVDADSAAKELSYKEAWMSQDVRLATLEAQLYEARGRTQLNTAERKRIEELIDNIQVQRDILKNERASSSYQLDRDSAESQFYKGAGKYAPYVREFGSSAKAILEGIGEVSKFRRGGRNTWEHETGWSQHHGEYYRNRRRGIDRGRR